ncbi:helix-turn-helix domain-containing protein [Niabella aquatica]
MNSAAHPNKIHEGRNVKRFREMLGIKQDALAYELGRACPEHSEGTWNQQKISLLEQKETIDVPLLQQIAEALKIPVEAFQNFDEEQAINLISNNATFENCQQPAFFNHHPVFNPIEAVLKMHDEKMALYERMLKEKDEMMAKLEQLIEKK